MVRMFKPQFAPLVESGEKRQTVRPTPKRMPKVGDPISLRAWIGLPYRSKQRVLRESVVTKVEPVEIFRCNLQIGSRDAFRNYAHPRDTEALDAFAKADGFAAWEDLEQWFAQTHELPFSGIVIHWS
jgi:hypothetical protein